MSNYQALGGVSESLRALLLDRMELPADAVGNFRVSIGPPRPDAQVNIDAAENPRVNLFLYRVEENASLKNQQIPGRGNSSAYGQPPLSIDLHYLVTGYGTREQQQGRFDETLAHYLIGSAMRVFHDFPVITEDLVTVRAPLGTSVLHDSLQGEFERIKITMESISLEDISKVWTALTLPFRVSSGYVVSVVQIEGTRRQGFPRRVQPPPSAGPRITVVPFQHPRILELRTRWSGDPPDTLRTAPYASIGDTLVLLGENLASANTRVRIDDLDIALGQQFDRHKLEVIVPDDMLPGGILVPESRRLQPGVHSVEVIVDMLELNGAGFPSNKTAFMLTPGITQTVSAALTAAPRSVTIQGTRLFSERLSGETVIGRTVVGKEHYIAATPTQITVPISDTLVAYPIQVFASGILGSLPNTLANTTMDVAIGTDGPWQVRFPRNPSSFQDLAILIERSFRSVARGVRGFRDARVGITSDKRLVLVSGGLLDVMTITPGGTADDLHLTAASGAEVLQAYQSGRLSDIATFTAGSPQIIFTAGAASATISLPAHPPSLAQLAQDLQNAILAADAAFADVRVIVAGNQLIVLAGTASTIMFAPVPGVDEVTVKELELADTAVVRVRVNGAESLKEQSVDLTL